MSAETQAAATRSEKEAALDLAQERVRELFIRYRIALRDAAAGIDPGLQPTAVALLSLLRRHGATSAGRAAHELLSDPSTISRQIRQLVDLNLVAVDIDPDDRRSRLLTLTPQGQELMARVSPAIREAFGRPLRSWDVDDLVTFADLLGRLVGHQE